LRGINVVGGRLRLRLARAGQTLEVEGDRDRIDISRLFPGAPVRLAFHRMRIFPRDDAGAAMPAGTEPEHPVDHAPIALAVHRMARLGS
jgi:hypothetical protein